MHAKLSGLRLELYPHVFCQVLLVAVDARRPCFVSYVWVAFY